MDTIFIHLIFTWAFPFIYFPLIQTRPMKRSENVYILSATVRSRPVMSTVAKQECVALQDSSGKSANGVEAPLVARNPGGGTWSKGGHAGGLGMGQVAAWIRVEYSIPHTASHVPSARTPTQRHPHRFLGFSSSWFTIFWRTTRSTQRMTGNTTTPMFVFKLRFCIPRNTVKVFRLKFYKKRVGTKQAIREAIEKPGRWDSCEGERWPGWMRSGLLWTWPPLDP